MLQTIPIVILHGLGERTWTMALFILWLQGHGYNNIHTPHWPANSCEMPDTCIPALVDSLQKEVGKNESIILIGNSMGGVAATFLENEGWKVETMILVAAPVHGASSMPSAEIMCYVTWQWAKGKSCVGAEYEGPYKYLSNLEKRNPPNSTYWTITPSVYQGFDGNVHREDAVFEESRNIDMFSHHFALAMDPRMWYTVTSLIDKNSCLQWDNDTILKSAIAVVFTLSGIYCINRMRHSFR